jgi:homoserine O-acetyltransferase
MVNSQHRLLTEVLGVDRLHAVVGVSMGGMQTFEWIVAYPEFVDHAVPVVGSPRLDGYDLLLWTTQLEVIENAYACDCLYDEAGEIVGMIGTLAT